MSVQGATQGDASELKENFKMVRAVNQQLFSEIQVKEKELTLMTDRIKGFEQLLSTQECLRVYISNLLTSINPGDKSTAHLTNILRLLEPHNR